MAIRIMDRNFNFLGKIDDFEDLFFKRVFVSFGDFKMTINKHKKNTQYLQQENIFMIDKDHIGIIEHSELSQVSKNESLLIQGFTLEKILNRRITEPPKGSAEWVLTGPAETVIKALVSYNLGPAAKPERQIPEIIIAPDLGRGEVIEFKTAYKPLDEEVKNICMNNGIGIQISYDSNAKKFLFDVILGKDLTAGQRINPPVTFSSEMDNILDQKLVLSTMDYKNTAITGGKGEGVKREIITVYGGEPVQGLDRREVFADIRDSDVTSETLPAKGKEKLEEYPSVFSLDGKINPEHSFVYGKDYALGDVVTRRYEDAALDTRITEVEQSWNDKGYSLTCAFGNKLPTLLDKIKNGVRT